MINSEYDVSAYKIEENFFTSMCTVKVQNGCKGVEWLVVNSSSPSISAAVIRRCCLQFTSNLLVFSFLALLM